MSQQACVSKLVSPRLCQHKKALDPPADSASPFCCHSGCISSSSALNPSSSALPLLLLVFRDLLCANSPMPAEANLCAYASGVPGVSPRVLCDGRGFMKPEDSRERLGGEFACAPDLHHCNELSDSLQVVSCMRYVVRLQSHIHWCNAGTRESMSRGALGNNGASWTLTCLCETQAQTTHSDCMQQRLYYYSKSARQCAYASTKSLNNNNCLSKLSPAGSENG